MKTAVIYFINFFHVGIIKLRERKVAKRRLTLISLHFFLSLAFFLASLSGIYRSCILASNLSLSYEPINFLDKNGMSRFFSWCFVKI